MGAGALGRITKLGVRTCLAVAALLFASGCAGFRSPDEAWARGTPVPDADYEEILRPDVPITDAGLVRGSDRRIYYVAKLAAPAPSDYEKTYEKLIKERGVLVEALGPTGHSPLRSVVGYKFLVFKKGDERTRTLLNRVFEDMGREDEQPSNRLASFASPLTLNGRDLVLRLGEKALRPWKEEVLLPERDLVSAPDLPIPRMPGAVLRNASKEDSEVFHQFAVPATDPEAVLAFYKIWVPRKTGLKMEMVVGAPHDVRFSGGGPDTQIEWIQILLSAIEVAEGNGMSALELSKEARSLAAFLDTGAVYVRIRVRFHRPAESPGALPAKA